MTPDMTLTQYVSTIETTATFLASLAFVIIYSITARWWRSALGRNLVAFDSALALTLLPSMVHHFFGVNTVNNAGFAWFTLIAFGFVPIVIVWRTAILIRLQLKGNDIHGEDGSGPRSDDVSPVPGPLPGAREPA
jgi:hypothetical protein